MRHLVCPLSRSAARHGHRVLHSIHNPVEQFVLAVLVAVAMKANVPLAAAATLISNPPDVSADLFRRL
jgi:hypothetical protein